MITLKHNTDSAQIRPHGAELASLRINGIEHIWEADPKYWGKSAPLLFPVVGILKDGKTRIGDAEYSIPKHGFARDSVFDCEQTAENQVQFTLCENEQTLNMYPFRFALRIVYTLSDAGLDVSYTVKNNDKTEMPFCFGLHPAFKCPIGDTEDLTDYYLQFEKAETLDSPRIDPASGMIDLENRERFMENETILPLNDELFAEDALVFEKINSQVVSLTNGTHTVTLTYNGFDSLGLWKPIGAPFICIEPWCGMNDRTDESGVFADKFGAITLAPQESRTFTLNIQVS